MGKTRGAAENSKKVAGNARKAAAAEDKKRQEQAQQDAAEDAKWSEGSKGKNKKEQDADRKAEIARKKAERDALLAEEEASLPSKSVQSKQRGAAKVAQRRTGKLDDFLTGDKDEVELGASNIDDAIAALNLSTGKGDEKGLDRHPERRIKAAYAGYEERRLPEIKKEQPGMRLNQYKDLLWKEFQKSDENPFNQQNVAYNASSTEVQEAKKQIRKGKEIRLAV